MLRIVWPLAGAAVTVGAVAACSASSSAAGFNAAGGGPASGGGGGGSSGSNAGDLSGSSNGSASGSSSGSSSTQPNDGGPVAVATTVTFVHASPGLFDKRLCWSVGGQMTTSPPFPSGAPMPASNYAGIPAGGAAMLADATELTRGPVTFFALDANILAEYERADTVRTCVERLQPNGTYAVPLQAWQELPAAPPVPRGGASVLAIEGCVAGVAGASTSACGPTWDAVQGNLHVEEVDVASLPTAAAGVLKVQAALLSPGLASALGDGGALDVAFGAHGVGDTFATLGKEGDVEPQSPALVALGTDATAFGALGFGVTIPARPSAADASFGDASPGGDGSPEAAGGLGAADATAEAATSDGGPAPEGGATGSSGPLLWMSLLSAESLVEPGTNPESYFGANVTYVAAILGDPSAPAFGASSGAVFDGRGLHVLVLPSRPQ